MDPGRLLDRFYIPTRYPDGLPRGIPKDAFTRQDSEAAFAAADEIRAYARARI